MLQSPSRNCSGGNWLCERQHKHLLASMMQPMGPQKSSSELLEDWRQQHLLRPLTNGTQPLQPVPKQQQLTTQHVSRRNWLVSSVILASSETERAIFLSYVLGLSKIVDGQFGRS